MRRHLLVAVLLSSCYGADPSTPAVALPIVDASAEDRLDECPSVETNTPDEPDVPDVLVDASNDSPRSDSTDSAPDASSDSSIDSHVCSSVAYAACGDRQVPRRSQPAARRSFRLRLLATFID